MFNNELDALNYLKSLDTIIIPIDYTYFHHNTSYVPINEKTSYNRKSWNEIPINGFVIKSEMSFEERDQRIKEALDYGSVNYASTVYAMPKGAMPFSIRVIIPKLDNKLGLSDEYQKQLLREYRGLGDMRHSKLGNGEKIYMFACSRKDEVSGKNIDILYGVRSQDIIMYASKVYEELSKNLNYPEPIMPKAYKVSGQSYYEKDTDYEFNHHTYSLPKDMNFNRYLNTSIVGSNMYMFSDFDQEYYESQRKK